MANKLVDWQVWTILYLLGMMACTILVWSIDYRLPQAGWIRPSVYGVLVFIGTYVGGQFVNHALTLWWVYHKRESLENPPK